MTETSFRGLKTFTRLAELPPDIRKEVDAYVRRTPVPTNWKADFTREQVLKALRRIPHTAEEFDKAFAEEEKAREKYQAEHPVDPGDTKTIAKELLNMRQAEPYTSLSGYENFIRSAILTLTEVDLPFLREERRKQVRMSDEAFYEWAAYTRIIEGVINRLDLYREYRVK